MAAISLEDTLAYAFNGNDTASRIVSYQSETHKSGTHYLEIPIKKNTFEVPVAAIDTFENMATAGSINADAISVTLYNWNRKAKYSTPDRNMRDILRVNWKYNHLVYIPVEYNGHTNVYYGSHGMLLTEDFKLLVVLSWQLRKVFDRNNVGVSTVKYQFVKPIIRINPTCFSGGDPMMRWCANKLFKTGLVDKVMFPFHESMRRSFKLENIEAMSPSIVIEESPFHIRTPDVPDVLTTREEILQPVIDHIDELLQ